MLQQLKERYERYQQEANDAASQASPWSGLWGFGNDPRKHACHDSFYRDVGVWAEEFLRSGPAAREAAEAVSWIVKAAQAHREEQTFGYLFAVQGHARALIPLMDPVDCRELQLWYDSAYKKAERLPVQKEVYKLLQNRAKDK